MRSSFTLPKEQEETLPSWYLETDSVDEKESTPLVEKETITPLNGDNDTYNAIVVVESKHNEEDFPIESNSNNEPPKPPRKNICLHIFGVFEMFAIVTCCRLLLMQIIPLFLAPLSQVGYLQLLLRIYVSLCCFLFVLVELEAPIPALVNSGMLQNYLTRGFLYSFVGLIGMEESYAVFVQELKAEYNNKRRHEFEEFHVAWQTLFIKGASLIMVVLGFVYILLGAFCLQHLREGLRKKHREAMERYREAKFLHEERQQEEAENGGTEIGTNENS